MEQTVRCILRHFNTSHVTVYRVSRKMQWRKFIISIHLMLLFIDTTATIGTITPHFNTSHVTVYRKIQLKKF